MAAAAQRRGHPARHPHLGRRATRTRCPRRSASRRRGAEHGRRCRHRFRRPDRLRVGPPSGRGRLGRDRPRERHAGELLRPRGLDRARDRASWSSATRVPLARRRHPRHRGRRPHLRRAGKADRAGDPHRRAALARLGGARAAHRLRHQRQRHPQPARGDARPLPRAPASSSAPPTRSTATRPTACRCRTRDAARAARGPPLLRRHRHLDVDRRAPPTRCSGSPRRPPTCWCRSTAATSTCRPSASAAAA